jgi:hypothetical protein
MNFYWLLKTLTHALLAIVSILLIFTGVSISNYQIVESLTGGAISKLISYQIHTTLTIPFVVLLFAHIGFTVGNKYWKKTSKAEKKI